MLLIRPGLGLRKMRVGWKPLFFLACFKTTWSSRLKKLATELGCYSGGVDRGRRKDPLKGGSEEEAGKGRRDRVGGWDVRGRLLCICVSYTAGCPGWTSRLYVPLTTATLSLALSPIKQRDSVFCMPNTTTNFSLLSPSLSAFFSSIPIHNINPTKTHYYLFIIIIVIQFLYI